MSQRALRVHADGVVLRVVEHGAGPPVVLLHGFTGSAATLTEIAAGLRDDHRTLSIDLVGHGGSEAPRELAPYRMQRCAAQVAAAVAALGAGPAHFIGYSMGGRVALALCAWRPDLVASALVVGARAGFADPAERATRTAADGALADRIERDGVEPFVDDWMTRPLFESQRRLGADALADARAQRLANAPHALANSLRGMGAGAQPPLHDELAEFPGPLCLAVGAEDARFRTVADELAARLPGASVALVPHAGHAAHLENPAAFLQIARRFLKDAAAHDPTQSRAPESLPAHARGISP